MKDESKKEKQDLFLKTDEANKKKEQSKTQLTSDEFDNALRKVLKENNIPTLQVAQYGIFALREMWYFIKDTEGLEEKFKEYLIQSHSEMQIIFMGMEDISYKYLDELIKVKKNKKDIS